MTKEDLKDNLQLAFASPFAVITYAVLILLLYTIVVSNSDYSSVDDECLQKGVTCTAYPHGTDRRGVNIIINP